MALERQNIAFTGEVWLGHLPIWGHMGENSIETCHPFLKKITWRSRKSCMAGDFQTWGPNVEEVVVQGCSWKLGQLSAIKEKTDTRFNSA